MEEKVRELALHLKTLERALATLKDIFQEPYSVIVRDAAIQRFEYTFELAWKMFRKAAKIEGIDTGSPRQAIRAVYDAKLIDDTDIWFQMLDDRNRVSHTYREVTAGEVFESARLLPDILENAIRSVKQRYDTEEEI